MIVDWKELILMTADDRAVHLARLRERLRDLRFRISQNQEKKVREVRAVRRAIARILTLDAKK